MADILRDLERSHEARFKLDQELRFKAECRRNKLFGLWAAEIMGLAADDAEAYGKRLVALGLEPDGGRSVVREVLARFAAHGVARSEDELSAALQRCHESAVESVARDFPRALGADHVQIGG